MSANEASPKATDGALQEESPIFLTSATNINNHKHNNSLS